MKTYHLAQINIARMRAPLDTPVMAGFVAQLASLNALAEASRGFVWRLQTEGGDATALQAFEDPLILVNMSVWASVEDLQNYAYRSAHVGAFRERQQWFDKMEAPHLALWWVPAGHQPTLEEAKRRLSHLQAQPRVHSRLRLRGSIRRRKGRDGRRCQASRSRTAWGHPRTIVVFLS